MTGAGSGFFVLFLVCAALAFQVLGDRRCREHIAAWAHENDLEVLDVRRRYLTLHFFWRSDQQRVYEVDVVDAKHLHRTAVVKVGGYFLGAFSEQVDARWL